MSKTNTASAKTSKKQKILEATLEIIGTSGLNEVTFRAVAKQANVPLGLTSYYFKDKDELYIEAYYLFYERSSEPVNTFAESVKNLLTDKDITELLNDKTVLIQRLTEITVQYIKTQTQYANDRKVAAAFMHAGIVNPIIREHVAKRQRAFIELGETLLTVLKVDKAEYVSTMFLALTNHIERQLLLENKKRFNRRYVEAVFQHFYSLIIDQ